MREAIDAVQSGKMGWLLASVFRLPHCGDVFKKSGLVTTKEYLASHKTAEC